MPSGSHIIVVRFGDAFPVDLGGGLCARGYRVTETVRLDDALPDWARIESPVLLLDCSRSGSTTERIVRALIEHRRILNCPIILASVAPRQVSELLAYYFPIIVTLQSPCSSDDIYSALDTVVRAKERLSGRDELFSDPSSIEERGVNSAIGRLSLADEEESKNGSSSMTGILFTHLANGGLDLSALRGDALTQPMTLSEVITAGLAPSDARCLEVAQVFLNRLDRAGRRHILRTTVLVGRLMEALQVCPSRRETGAAAALIYAWGFGEGDPDLVRQLYLSRRHREVRVRFAHGLACSARRVEEELGRDDIAQILRCFEAFVARTPVGIVDIETSELAMVIFGAESVVRICYQSGLWNPRHAYKVLQRLESGWFRDLPLPLMSALARIVAGAVTEQPRSFLVPRQLRSDPQLLGVARAHRESTLRHDEQRVDMADLWPGMRLARAVETFDGITILESGLVLDDDLIWRLWRLSAIRPVNGPLIVERCGEDRAQRRGSTAYGGAQSLGAEIDAIIARCVSEPVV